MAKFTVTVSDDGLLSVTVKTALPGALPSFIVTSVIAIDGGGLTMLTVSICPKMNDCTPGESMSPSGGVVSPLTVRPSAL